MEFTEMQAQEAARSAGIDLEKERFDLKALTAGMNAELEHGTANPDTNITNDDPVMTAKLAAAHLRVSPFYYASGRGLKAWEASLRRGVKVKSSKTEHKTLSFRTEEYDEESGIFSGYAAAYGLPKDTPEQAAHKAAVLETALDAACAVPLEIMGKCAEGIALVEEYAAKGSALAVSDAGCAAALCKAALQAASLNVFINTKLMTDKTHAAALDAQADALLSEYVPKADAVFAQVTKQLRT